MREYKSKICTNCWYKKRISPAPLKYLICPPTPKENPKQEGLKMKQLQCSSVICIIPHILLALTINYPYSWQGFK